MMMRSSSFKSCVSPPTNSSNEQPKFTKRSASKNPRASSPLVLPPRILRTMVPNKTDGLPSTPRRRRANESFDELTRDTRLAVDRVGYSAKTKSFTLSVSLDLGAHIENEARFHRHNVENVTWEAFEDFLRQDTLASNGESSSSSSSFISTTLKFPTAVTMLPMNMRTGYLRRYVEHEYTKRPQAVIRFLRFPDSPLNSKAKKRSEDIFSRRLDAEEIKVLMHG